ncbi:type II toxin-antitoxin system PemK/MazF family toxin [Lachnospiraceae bacterium 47-T17]
MPLLRARHIQRQNCRTYRSKVFEGLDRDSIVLLEQIRTADKKRLKQYMGIMPAEAMARADKALAISIGTPQRNPS